jgi:hypothetical protein
VFKGNGVVLNVENDAQEPPNCEANCYAPVFFGKGLLRDKFAVS